MGMRKEGFGKDVHAPYILTAGQSAPSRADAVSHNLRASLCVQVKPAPLLAYLCCRVTAHVLVPKEVAISSTVGILGSRV